MEDDDCRALVARACSFTKDIPFVMGKVEVHIVTNKLVRACTINSSAS